MTKPIQKNLTLLAVLGLLYWFFGNLYETIVISPNWIVDSPAQMQRLNHFFVRTSPTLYFVPLTQIATLLVWLVWLINREDYLKRDYKMAAIFAAFSTLLNFFIVSTIVIKLFGDDFMTRADQLNTLCWRWNVLNTFRMIVVFTTTHFMFQAFRKLDKAG